MKNFALVGARVSVMTDSKVSNEAQIDTGLRWAAANGYEVLDTFQDLGISATVAPEDRPDLGRWLTPEGADQWQAIVWSKVDRAFRSAKHCVDFVSWAETNHKVVVFAEDNLILDYRPGAANGLDAMMSAFFVQIAAFFASVELNRFRSRALDGHRTLRQTDRWASGKPPYGFTITDHPSGKGRALQPDPIQQEALQAAAKLLLDGESFIRITEWMNQHHPKERPWTVTGVIGILTSPATQGLKLHNKQPVLDGSGEPIAVAEPTFDPDTWNQIQEAAALRRLNQRRPTTSTNPLLGIGICSECFASLSLQTSTKGQSTYHYFRCGRTPKPCPQTSTKAELLLGLLQRRFLEKYGDRKVTRRVFVAGSDTSHDLAKVNASIERLRTESDAGLIVTPEDETMYLQRMKALIARRTKLESTPSVKAGWVIETTDKTYAEQWEEEDTLEGQRNLILESGIKLALIPGKKFPHNAFLFEDSADGEWETRMLINSQAPDSSQ